MLVVLEEKTSQNQQYSKIISSLLKRIFPQDINRSALPKIKYEKISDSFQYSISLLFRLRPGAGRFVYDMIRRWLIPNRKTSIGVFFISDFKFPLDEQVYTIAEVVISLKNEEEEQIFKQNIKVLKKELLLGLQSSYLANRILEIKGLTSNEKVAFIHERIAEIVRRLPTIFDYDIFSKMQNFLVKSSDEFKQVHDYRYMSRIIYILYIMQKKLCEKTNSYQRHILCKLVPFTLRHPLGFRKAIGIFIGLNFLKEHEVFEKRHMIKAVVKAMPAIKIIEESSFVDEQTDDNISLLYIEAEKEDGTYFSIQEMKKMQKRLPNQIKNSIEHLLRPVFMPRNEEEILKNLLVLSGQLKYVKDFPQIMISFDEQTDTDLYFTVIMARILLPMSSQIEEIVKKTKQAHIAIERVKRMGTVRKKYSKEASVLRIRLRGQPFLRDDLSLDLYAARQKIVEALEECLGEFRDFTGGMIAKQREAFDHLQSLLPDGGVRDKFLLENFFHSIFPVEQRSTLSAQTLKDLFGMFKKLLEEASQIRPVTLHLKEEQNQLLALMQFNDLNLKGRVVETVNRLGIPSRDLAILQMQVYESVYLGYVYFFECFEDKQSFLRILNF